MKNTKTARTGKTVKRFAGVFFEDPAFYLSGADFDSSGFRRSFLDAILPTAIDKQALYLCKMPKSIINSRFF